MEYQALYRKYRPQKFNDVVDQESTIKILTNSLKEGHIFHAYLFSGPRGTGKTTIAKLVAKTVNCLNLNSDFSICGKCENCVDILNNSSDIIEIDAASNNGVDEIRELKSKINLVPNKLKYKVYIIDEVHMLSISAFNALLKTLEEPPSHVIFILATTEFYKVPKTIISRCQCLNFTKIQTASIEKKLKQISEIEKINIDDDAIHEIAEYSDGGMRDALGMLDKLASYSLEKITCQDFITINGLISQQDMRNFIKNILNSKNKIVIDNLNDFENKGYDISKLIEKMMVECKDLMIDCYINKNVLNPHQLYKLIMCLNDTYNLLKESANRKIILEVNLLKFMNPEETEIENTSISREIAEKNTNIREIKVESSKKVNWTINSDVKRNRINNTFALASKVLKNIAVKKWEKINDYSIDKEYSHIVGLLKDSTLGVVSDKNIILTTKYNSVIDEVYQNFSKVVKFVNLIMEKEYKIVILTEQEFSNEVENYKKHINDKDYYEYHEDNRELINMENIEKKENLEYTDLVGKAIDIFGKEVVEIE